MEGAWRRLGQEKRKNALQWQLRLEVSRSKWEMSRVVDKGRKEVMGQHGSIIIWGSETRMGKASGTVKSGAEKVKSTPKSSPRQNRSKEKSPQK